MAYSDRDGGRVYFVIDMKTFFASVECAERGLDPFETNLVVADESRGKGSVCLAISPKMKSLGVQNRCRLYEIPPDIDYIIAKPRMKKYIEYSANIYEIYLKYIDKNDIHVYSIDECIIDVTDYLKLYKVRAKKFAQMLMKEISDTLHIPSTCGIGTNMYLAKVALDITAKHSPDKIGWLNEQKYKDTLWDHTPITDFWQISTGISNRLAKIGVKTMRGIASLSEDLLYDMFGINAELLIDHAYGREPCTMQDIKNYKSKSKSLGSSQVLPRNYDFVEAKLAFTEMLQSGCYDLAKHHLVTDLVVVHVGYGFEDSIRQSDRFSVRLGKTTNLYSEMVNIVMTAFEKNVNPLKLIRRLSYEFAGVIDEKNEQYDMFANLKKIEKEKNLVQSVLKIQDKFGKNSLLKGNDLKKGATQIERNKLIGGHNSGE